MNTEFLEQLEGWFERLQNRLQSSPLAGQDWVQAGLRNLQLRKSDLLEHGPDVPRYNRLCLEAERLMQRLLSCEGPTGVAWLNQPLRDAYAFLEGHSDLDPSCGELFEAAFERLKMLGVGQPLQDLSQDLMLWSGGHNALGPRDLRNKLDDFVAAALAEEAIQGDEAWTLESLLTGYFRTGSEQIWQRWEDQILALEAELGQLAENQVDVQQLLLETESLRNCPRDQEELWEQLERVRQEWSTISQLLSLQAVRQADGSEQPRLQHLDRLHCLAQEFQQGTLEVDDFHYEVEVHSQRLTGALPHFWKLWADQPDRLACLAELQTSLQQLAQINRPGDPRLAPLTESYCDLMRQLHAAASPLRA